MAEAGTMVIEVTGQRSLPVVLNVQTDDGNVLNIEHSVVNYECPCRFWTFSDIYFKALRLLCILSVFVQFIRDGNLWLLEQKQRR